MNGILKSNSKCLIVISTNRNYPYPKIDKTLILLNVKIVIRWTPQFSKIYFLPYQTDLICMYILVFHEWIDCSHALCTKSKMAAKFSWTLKSQSATRSRQNTQLRSIYGRERNLVGITPLQLIYWDYLLGAEVSLLDGKWVIWFIRKVTRV